MEGGQPLASRVVAGHGRREASRRRGPRGPFLAPSHPVGHRDGPPKAAPTKVKQFDPIPELRGAETAYVGSVRQITRTIAQATRELVLQPLATLVGDGGPDGAKRVRRAVAGVVAVTRAEHPATDLEERIEAQTDRVTRVSGVLFVDGVAEDLGIRRSTAQRLATLGEQIDEGDLDEAEAVEATDGDLDEIAIALILARGKKANTRRANGRFRRDNRKLLNSLPVKHSRSLSKDLGAAVIAGVGLLALRKMISDRTAITGRRGDTIAIDQTQKLQGEQQRDRQTGAGVGSYGWKDQSDDDVRDDHETLNGTVQSWDNPPSLGPGHPGEPPNCRCFAVPNMDQAILEFTSGPEAEGFKAAQGERLLTAGL